MTWLPAPCFIALALLQLGISFLAHDYARYGLLVHEAALKGLSAALFALAGLEIGRASCRERV